ncbi:MAG: bifunctional riboflavin kinase/FAD synthetase [Caulobacteraceae bacterium]|nr:bifunctional riboflavin kinase/FAD synthetase [Caulobacter sp.]
MKLRIVEGWRGLDPELKGSALALGAFDGVHRGHQEVIALAARAAAALGAPLGVVTFEPHPRRWFRPDEPLFRLTTLDQQAQVLDALGVDRLHRIPFDAELAAMGDEAFAREVLGEGLGARHVAAGFDISFGKGRTGSPDLLRRYGQRYGFGVTIAEAVEGEGGKLSSTAVRTALRDGAPDRAAAILGRPFSLEGVVVHGDKLGRTIGFPTANIPLGDYVRVRHGIYATRTRLADGREVAGVAYVGRRPTIENACEERLEVHLFDFDEDLYGQTLETDLVAFLRPDEKFDGLEAMTEQMERDKAQARALLLPELG